MVSERSALEHIEKSININKMTRDLAELQHQLDKAALIGADALARSGDMTSCLRRSALEIADASMRVKEQTRFEITGLHRFRSKRCGFNSRSGGADCVGRESESGDVGEERRLSGGVGDGRTTLNHTHTHTHTHTSKHNDIQFDDTNSQL